jgi:hypothetical protein
MKLPFFRSKKFKAPLNTAVYTTTYVIKENSFITLVAHELDGDWQFMGSETITEYEKMAAIVGLGEIIKRDKSVLKVADLPIGYQAVRKNKSDKWTIQKIEYTDEELNDFGFYCSNCGMYHHDVPMSYGSDAPMLYFLIPEEERADKAALTADQCIIYDKRYYIRGVIEIPVEGHSERFSWSVWVEVNKTDFDRIHELWEDDNRILEAPFVGELSSQLEPYPQTCGLVVKVVIQKVGFAPKIELIETDHPLYFEQENGIDKERVISFAKKILYNH